MGTQSNMKFLVLSACVALSSAQLVAYPNGAVVPADTAEVHAAKVAHAAAGGAVHPVHAFGYAAAYPYFGGLVGHANGAVVPVDTPEVHAAKVALRLRCRLPLRLPPRRCPCARWLRWTC